MKKKVNKNFFFLFPPRRKENFISVLIGVKEHITIIKVTRPDSFITKHQQKRIKTFCNFIQFSRKKVREKFFTRTHKPQNLNSSYSNECLNKKREMEKKSPKSFVYGLCATIDWLWSKKL